MGKDYRIGLIAGSILAGVAIIWVATRPSLTPRLQPVQLPQDAGPASEANTPEADGQKAADKTPRAEVGSTSQPVLRPPASAIPNPSAGTSGQKAGEKDESTKAARFHVVRPGETLSAISQQYYGTSNNWRKILAANEKTIKDPSKVPVGAKLIIPE